MEPVADFLDDVFIICFAYRFWILAAVVVVPLAAWAVTRIFRHRTSRAHSGHPHDLPHHYGDPFHS